MSPDPLERSEPPPTSLHVVPAADAGHARPDLEAELALSRRQTQDAYRDSARLVRILEVLAQPADGPAILIGRVLRTVASSFSADLVCWTRSVDPSSHVDGSEATCTDVVIHSFGFPRGASPELPVLPEPLRGPDDRSGDPGRARAAGWNAPDDMRLVVSGVHVRSAARVPVDPIDASCGAILIMRSEPVSFSATELHLLQSVVGRLQAAVLSTESRLGAQLLAQAGDRFNQDRPADVVLQDAAGLLAAITGADWTGVVEIDADGRQHLRAQDGAASLDLAPMFSRSLPVPTSVGMRSSLTLPVVLEGRVEMQLCALDATPSAFSRVAHDVCGQLATYLGAALVSARLYRVLRQNEQQMRHRATHDALTGLANRDLLRERLAQRLARNAPGSRLGVLFCDLDDFKAINDRLGHDAGDRLLQVVAERLTAATRSDDLVARQSGDEFVVVVDQVRDEGELKAVAERLLAEIGSPCALTDARGRPQWVRSSASIGGAVADTDGPTIDPRAPLRDADTAMYEAKRAGGGRARVFDARAAQLAHRDLDLATALPLAVDDGQIDVHYQPIWDLSADRPVGLEALARWTHPQHGAVGPDQFIPMAERSGCIDRLGAHVLARACHELTRWRTTVPLTVAVNVSPLELASDGFADRTLATLAEHGLRPGDLHLEVTEGLPLGGPEARQLSALRAAGVGVLIDDFGVAHSDLARLKHLPVDGIKIDRSLITGLTPDAAANPLDHGLVEAILVLARSGNLTVIAEGVETTAQREALVRLGCDTAQGWLLGRPMPSARLTDVLPRGR